MVRETSLEGHLKRDLCDTVRALSLSLSLQLAVSQFRSESSKEREREIRAGVTNQAVAPIHQLIRSDSAVRHLEFSYCVQLMLAVFQRTLC